MIHYEITSQNPATHYFNLRILIDTPDPAGQVLRLPNWVPGSYMIRDLSRHLISLQAASEGKPLTIQQLDKSNWRVEPVRTRLTIEYLVYANDLSVRGAHLDHTHGYFNGSSVFLQVLGQQDNRCAVCIHPPAAQYCQDWQLATTLPRKQGAEFEFGRFQAEDYEELIDHPVEMGHFQTLRFHACGIAHDMILSGRFRCDSARLAQDLSQICAHHIGFFGEPAPFSYYQFQVLVVGVGRGGLEHRNSSSLICDRESLPQQGQAKMTDHYRNFLRLCSHEYFHSWHVKRIRPAVYQQQPDLLQREVYTELLWAFEGITSYYEDLALVRCGLLDSSTYLKQLGQTITRVLRSKGADRQSAAESSFNAWTRFYQQDENAQNAIVSYYTKGCLIALCIDLKMRQLSHAEHSLDDVMRALWQDAAQGVEAESIQALICRISKTDLQPFLEQLIKQTGPLPLTDLLATVGIELHSRGAINQQDLGGKPARDAVPEVSFGAYLKAQNDGLKIIRVDEDGSAMNAGLSTGDCIIAVNGIRLNLQQLQQQLALARISECWKIHAFRRDELYEFELTLLAAPSNTIFLSLSDQQTESRQAWLSGQTKP